MCYLSRCLDPILTRRHGTYSIDRRNATVILKENKKRFHRQGHEPQGRCLHALKLDATQTSNTGDKSPGFQQIMAKKIYMSKNNWEEFILTH